MDAPPADVFGFLVDLEKHWLVAGRFIQVVALEGPEGAHHGGRVRIHGPLGLRRTAQTKVEGAEPPHRLFGKASVGRHTEARVSWQMSANGERGTRIRLEAQVVRAGIIDRVALALGGRIWMRHGFRTTLAGLAARLDRART